MASSWLTRSRRAEGEAHSTRVPGWRAAIFGGPNVDRRGWHGAPWQLVVMVPPSLLYFLVRDLSAGQESAAYQNARSIVDAQKALGLDWEATLQQRILDTDWLVTLFNWVYIYGHFPLLISSLVLLFGLSRRNFITLRNALIASGAIGLVCFALFPVAPPRLFDTTLFFDSLTELSSSYKILQNPKLTNQFAAVPSFHVAWNLLVAIAVWRAVRFRAVKLVAVIFPLLMAAAVVLTANHWLFDIAAGVAVALIGLAVAAGVDHLTRDRADSTAADKTPVNQPSGSQTRPLEPA